MKRSALVAALIALSLTACGQKPAEAPAPAPAPVAAPAPAPAASAPAAADAAASTPSSLHVVYINTSLLTKARPIAELEGLGQGLHPLCR